MAKVAVVGDSTSVAGFRPLGFSVFPVGRPDEAVALWPELASGEYAVVLVTEQVYAVIGELADKIADQVTPAVTVIPGASGSAGIGASRLAAAVERAMGTRQLLSEEER